MSCDDQNAYKCSECADAWKTYIDSKQFYGCTEEAYPISNIDDVRIGDCIQIRRNGERIWLKVIAVCDCFYIGLVMFKLTQQHPFKKGDLVEVGIQQVFNVERKAAWCLNYKAKNKI